MQVILSWGFKNLLPTKYACKTGFANNFFWFNSSKSYSARNWEVISFFSSNQTPLGLLLLFQIFCATKKQKPSNERAGKGHVLEVTAVHEAL